MVAIQPYFSEEWLSFPDNGYHGLFEIVQDADAGHTGET